MTIAETAFWIRAHQEQERSISWASEPPSPPDEKDGVPDANGNAW
jgi:hypothetical protein